MFKFLVLFFIASTAYAGDCDHLYPNNKQIQVKNTLELCNRQYVAVYDATLHRNVFSSEFVSKNRTRMDRKDNFRIDQRVPYVKPAFYRNSGYDRGHQAPAANANDEIAMNESFLMTNITPQAGGLNSGPWKQLEAYIRKVWIDDHHIITGAVYTKKPIMIGPNKDIPVPISYYKCVVDYEVVCYVAYNKDDALVHTATPKEVNRIAKINIFK